MGICVCCEFCGETFWATSRRVKRCARCKLYYNQAYHIVKTIEYRCRLSGTEFNLDAEEIFWRIMSGCEKSGLAFVLGQNTRGHLHLRAPTIDRIDPDKGYTKDNIQVVIWWYNEVKRRYSDEEITYFCKQIAKHAA